MRALNLQKVMWFIITQPILTNSNWKPPFSAKSILYWPFTNQESSGFHSLKINVFTLIWRYKLMLGTFSFLYKYYAKHHNNCRTILNGFLIGASTKEWTGKTIYYNFSSIFGDFFLDFLKKRWVNIWADLIPKIYMSVLIITLKISTRGTICRAAPKL